MSTDAPDTTSITKFRTLAADMKAVRKARGDTADEAPDEVSAATDEVDDLKAAQANDVAPTPEPEPIPPAKPPKQRSSVASSQPPQDPPTPKKEALETPPPFHSLKKSVRKDDVEEVARQAGQDRQSVLEDGENGLAINGRGAGANDAAVVTDRKRRQHNFFSRAWFGIKDWFGDIKNRYITPQPPKYTVSSAYREKGVIKAAGVKSGKSLVDHKSTISRIRNRQKQTATRGDEKKKEKEPLLLLEAPDADTSEHPTPVPQTANVVTEPRKTQANQAQKDLAEREAALSEREAALQAAEIAAEERLKAAEAKATAAQEQAAAALTAAEAEAAQLKAAANDEVNKEREAELRAAEAAAEERVKAAEAEAEAAEAEAEAELAALRSEIAMEAAEIVAAQQADTREGNFAEEDEEAPSFQLSGRPLREQLGDTNFASLLTLVGITVVVVLIVVGQFVYNYYSQSDTSSASPLVSQTLPNTEASDLTIADTTVSPSGLTSLIRDHITNTDASLVTVTLTTPNGPPISSDRLFTLLDLTPPAGFVRSLQSTHLGGYDRNYPFLVMRTTSFEVAFGGMLGWEPTLVSDLQQLFNISGDLSGRPFSDQTVAGKDVRVFQGPGENGVVYGFIDDTTLLITPNQPVFEIVAERLRE